MASTHQPESARGATCCWPVHAFMKVHGCSNVHKQHESYHYHMYALSLWQALASSLGQNQAL
eukprot:896519-Pelagomonas_calceolata.AAC.2